MWNLALCPWGGSWRQGGALQGHRPGPEGGLQEPGAHHHVRSQDVRCTQTHPLQPPGASGARSAGLGLLLEQSGTLRAGGWDRGITHPLYPPSHAPGRGRGVAYTPVLGVPETVWEPVGHVHMTVLGPS